jgi:hypothetical protein
MCDKDNIPSSNENEKQAESFSIPKEIPTTETRSEK